MLWDSFFDDENESPHSFSIWKKCDDDFSRQVEENHKTIFQGVLCKAEKRTKGIEMSERLFVLTDKCLLYKKVASCEPETLREALPRSHGSAIRAHQAPRPQPN